MMTNEKPITSRDFCTSFPPVVGDNPHTLILGSMPGERSLQEQRYYAYPHNAFWPIMADICKFPVDADYAVRLDALKQRGFALWDVLQHCQRHGSLDSSIEKETEIPNKIIKLLEKYDSISRICFNGGKAETSFRKHLLGELSPDRELHLIRLPSTSPAYAAMPFERKATIWRENLRPRSIQSEAGKSR